jgi:cyclase
MAMSFENVDLRAEELAAGVWALLVRPGGAMAANGGLIDLGGTTVAWDSGITLLAGGSIREAAMALTGRPPDILLLSHPHRDHYFGAAALPESLYISSVKSREILVRDGVAQARESKSTNEAQLAALRSKVELETDPAKLAELMMALQSFSRGVKGFPGPEGPRLPTLTVEHSLTLQGARRSAEFRVLGNGHSPSDGVLYLPQDQIVFSGDLALPAGNLFLNVGGDERHWPQLLNQLAEIGAERQVPGHGPVSPVAASVEAARGYLRELFAALETGMASGQGPEWADSCPVPERWAEAAWRRNLKGLLKARLA